MRACECICRYKVDMISIYQFMMHEFFENDKKRVVVVRLYMNFIYDVLQLLSFSPIFTKL